MKKKALIVFDNMDDLRYKLSFFKYLLGDKILEIKEQKERVIIVVDDCIIFLSLGSECTMQGRVDVVFNLMQNERKHNEVIRHFEKRSEFE